MQLILMMQSRLPQTRIVVGGPGAHSFTGPDSGAHAVVLGPGETALAGLVQELCAGDFPCQAPERPRVIRGRNPRGEWLDDLASPYCTGVISPGPMVYWETSRGCPHNCSFCILGMENTPLRWFSIDFLAAELAWARGQQKTAINICDAAFNYNTGRLDQITRMIRAIDPQGTMDFTFAVHSDYVTAEQVACMQRINIRQASVGLNSINPDTFALSGRSIDPEAFTRSIDMLNQAVRPHATIIMGLPGDTPRGFEQTLDFCAGLEADTNIFELKVFPGSPFHHRKNELEIAVNRVDGISIASCASFSAGELEQMRRTARDYADRYDNIGIGDDIPGAHAAHS